MTLRNLLIPTIGLILPLALAQPMVDVELDAELVADGLTAPLLLESPAQSEYRFIVDQVGIIHVLTPDGELSQEPFLDISDRLVPLLEGFEERGLLGLAFHPDFDFNGRFYVHYSAPLRESAPAGWDHTSRISEFRVSADDPRVANPESERVILEVDQPNQKTNAGALAFGPRGYLYIAMGEGGGAHGIGEVVYDALEVPETGNVWDQLAQDLSTLYGKILRLDVDRGWPGYAVPPTNPLVGKPGLDEIYAWGFRNHYRMSFDSEGDEDLFVAAVGEALWESIYLVDEPGNYGWPLREGSHCYDRQSPLDPPDECPETGPNDWPILDPIVEYGNMNLLNEEATVDAEPAGTAVVGVHVYRGNGIPELQGKLVFADYSADPMTPSGQLFVAAPPSDIGAQWPWQQIFQFDARILSTGQDAEGEIYILTSEEIGPIGSTGKVYRLVPANEQPGGQIGHADGRAN